LVGGIIADIILIVTFIASTLEGANRGFTVLVFNLVCWIITIIAVFLLCKPVTNFIYEKTNIDESFSKGIQSTIGNFIEKQIEKNGQIDNSKTNISTSVVTKINGYIEEAKDNSVKNVSKYIADKLSYIVISALVIIILLITIRIATIFLRTFLEFLTDLPLIHSLDYVGGLLYGLFRAYIIIYFVLAVFSLLSPILANTGIIASIRASRICSIFYNNNVLLNILMK